MFVVKRTLEKRPFKLLFWTLFHTRSFCYGAIRIPCIFNLTQLCAMELGFLLAFKKRKHEQSKTK